eukprot:217317_1
MQEPDHERADTDLIILAFRESIDYINSNQNENHLKLSESERLRLHGLKSQALQGACDREKPPLEPVERWEWNAWRSESHLSKDEARNMFVENVYKLASEIDPKFMGEDFVHRHNDFLRTMKSFGKMSMDGYKSRSAPDENFDSSSDVPDHSTSVFAKMEALRKLHEQNQKKLSTIEGDTDNEQTSSNDISKLRRDMLRMIAEIQNKNRSREAVFRLTLSRLEKKMDLVLENMSIIQKQRISSRTQQCATCVFRKECAPFVQSPSSPISSSGSDRSLSDDEQKNSSTVLSVGAVMSSCIAGYMMWKYLFK